MNRIDFYKNINYTVLNKLEKNKDSRILILYDFSTDYFDIKNNKVRIGIKDKNKFSILSKKLQDVENKLGGKFNVIDMRMSLKYGFNTEEDLELLFKFIQKHKEKSGKIIGFINTQEEIEKELMNRSEINKGDEIWTVNVYSPDSEYCQNPINVKNKNNEETQYMVCMERLNNILKKFKLKIKSIIPLDEYNTKENNLKFTGEKFIII
jgi:hypothetical protein